MVRPAKEKIEIEALVHDWPLGFGRLVPLTRQDEIALRKFSTGRNRQKVRITIEATT